MGNKNLDELLDKIRERDGTLSQLVREYPMEWDDLIKEIDLMLNVIPEPLRPVGIVKLREYAETRLHSAQENASAASYEFDFSQLQLGRNGRQLFAGVALPDSIRDGSYQADVYRAIAAGVRDIATLKQMLPEQSVEMIVAALKRKKLVESDGWGKVKIPGQKAKKPARSSSLRGVENNGRRNIGPYLEAYLRQNTREDTSYQTVASALESEGFDQGSVYAALRKLKKQGIIEGDEEHIGYVGSGKLTLHNVVTYINDIASKLPRHQASKLLDYAQRFLPPDNASGDKLSTLHELGEIIDNYLKQQHDTEDLITDLMMSRPYEMTALREFIDSTRQRHLPSPAPTEHDIVDVYQDPYWSELFSRGDGMAGMLQSHVPYIVEKHPRFEPALRRITEDKTNVAWAAYSIQQTGQFIKDMEVTYNGQMPREVYEGLLTLMRLPDHDPYRAFVREIRKNGRTPEQQVAILAELSGKGDRVVHNVLRNYGIMA